MQIRKILFPTDFSEGSELAFRFASSLARDNKARLLMLHVNEPNVVYTEGMAATYGSLPEEQRKDARKILETVKPPVDGIEIERRVVTGVPADVIVELAKSEGDVDLVVLGTHGRTGLSRLLMGSVAENVVRKSPCSVLTIKEPSQDENA